jgi:nucleoside-diphosphate kinase
MAIERTLSIVKPDAVEKNSIGGVLALIEAAGLKIRALKLAQLTKEQAEGFYAVHKERPFYGELVEFISRSPVVLAAVEGENAVARYREVLGATDPAKAADGTIRKLYGASIGENAAHGSDSVENGKIEVAYFFPELG